MTEILNYTSQFLHLTPWLFLHTQRFITEGSKGASEIRKQFLLKSVNQNSSASNSFTLLPLTSVK